MSDDSLAWTPNLPGGKNATHNIALSPLFYAANAGTDPGPWSLLVIRYHVEGWYISSVSQKAIEFYALSTTGIDLSSVRPMFKYIAQSLRCLVSTNNRLMNKEEISLVSDDEYNGSTDANRGATLPEGIDAIYNAGLSPFFYMRNGRGSNTTGQEYATMWRGLNGSLWSSTANSDTFIHFLLIGRLSVSPSYDYNRSIAQSLRCLVSTNNRIIIKPLQQSLSQKSAYFGER